MAERCSETTRCLCNAIRLTVYWRQVFHSDICSPLCSFRSNVVFAKCPLNLVCVGHLSFWMNFVQPYVHSTKFFSINCPFGHTSFGHLSVRPFVFRQSVLSPSALVLSRCSPFWNALATLSKARLYIFYLPHKTYTSF